MFNKSKENATGNGFTNNGTINGNAAMINNGIMSADIAEINIDNNLAQEISKAKNIINNFEPLNKAQKNELIKILNETSTSINDRDNNKVNQCKEKFKNALLFLGDVGLKLISAFSNLITLVKFFGI